MTEPTFENDRPQLPYAIDSIAQLLEAASIVQVRSIVDGIDPGIALRLLEASTYSEFIACAQHGLEPDSDLVVPAMRFFGNIFESIPVNVLEQAVPALIERGVPDGYADFVRFLIEAKMHATSTMQPHEFTAAWPDLVRDIEGALPTIIEGTDGRTRAEQLIRQAITFGSNKGVAAHDPGLSLLVVQHLIHGRAVDGIAGHATFDALRSLAALRSLDTFRHICIGLQTTPYSTDGDGFTAADVPFATDVADMLYRTAFALQVEGRDDCARAAIHSAMQVESEIIEALGPERADDPTALAQHHEIFVEMSTFADLVQTAQRSRDTDYGR